MDQPTFSIVQGYLGAEKTPFSKRDWPRKPARSASMQTNGFSATLYGPSLIKTGTSASAAPSRSYGWRQQRDVILDFGFLSRASRDHARGQASALQANYVHYYLYAPNEVLLARIRNRTGAVAERNVENFQKMKAHFDEPDSDEKAIRIENGKPAAAEAPQAG